MPSPTYSGFSRTPGSYFSLMLPSATIQKFLNVLTILSYSLSEPSHTICNGSSQISSTCFPKASTIFQQLYWIFSFLFQVSLEKNPTVQPKVSPFPALNFTTSFLFSILTSLPLILLPPIVFSNNTMLSVKMIISPILKTVTKKTLKT